MAQAVLKKSDRNTLVAVAIVLAAGALLLAAFAGPAALYPVLAVLFFALFALTVHSTRLQRNELNDLRSEIQGMLFVHQQLEPGSPLPKSSNASLSWEAAALLVSELRQRAPGLVVELGAGVSTVLVAEALRRNGNGRLVTLEHDAYWAGYARGELARRGLEAWAEVRHAPLEPLRLEASGEQPWYALGAVQDLAGIDLLIVDGPPRRVAPLARYPALPVLRDKLAPGALVFVDDADRESEVRTVELWGSLGIRALERLPTKTGTALLWCE
jgi:predicted O-methyltransferase YrrM